MDICTLLAETVETSTFVCFQRRLRGQGLLLSGDQGDINLCIILASAGWTLISAYFYSGWGALTFVHFWTHLKDFSILVPGSPQHQCCGDIHKPSLNSPQSKAFLKFLTSFQYIGLPLFPELFFIDVSSFWTWVCTLHFILFWTFWNSHDVHVVFVRCAPRSGESSILDVLASFIFVAWLAFVSWVQLCA